MIKPKPGMAFIGADWSQQEIGIAAALSGDQRYLDAYNKDRDVYLTLANMAGAVPPPPEATKKSHPIERQTFKAVLLGLGYGMGVESLGLDVYEANRDEEGVLTLDAAHLTAEDIYEWHQETFSDYWEWIWDTIDRARVDGYIRTVDGWTYFVDDSVKTTQRSDASERGGDDAPGNDAVLAGRVGGLTSSAPCTMPSISIAAKTIATRGHEALN